MPDLTSSNEACLSLEGMSLSIKLKERKKISQYISILPGVAGASILRINMSGALLFGEGEAFAMGDRNERVYQALTAPPKIASY